MKTISNCFIGCDKSVEKSELLIFGAPYDGTSSFRPGSRFAPDKIREASYGLETYSPDYDMDIEDLNVGDIGNVEFPFGEKDKVFKEIRSCTANLLDMNKKILCLGGEHLITLPIIEELSRIHGNLKLIHMDAHADMRDTYISEKLSHATVLNNITELIGHKNIFHYGIRSGTREEFDKIAKFNNLNMKNGKLSENIGDDPVYLTIDLDILDTSVLPGTGTPEPGGLTFKELSELLFSFKGFNFVGADVVELAPDYDITGVSSIVAAKVVRNAICTLLS
ncbi:agmatinase [Flexistipes sinusarabici DSM 4947]|uniref:Agmatinase n=1 Tax=Flexistipes sinusarabici (strain ATCC 49648 / DSM 4947 / MAS 10) TaxID=717231 RepID=F8E6K6_FLESM|nr:agmatinase [Flexistipes sinusarabici]AEI14843.1 agmatinase [Flexistipes sinusarabici DSM 4947]